MENKTRETRINEAIVGIRMAQAVIEFAMESGKFESSIVLNDMQERSDDLDVAVQLLMDIRNGKELTDEEENDENARRAMGMVELCTNESEEVPTDKGAIIAMKRLRNYCKRTDCNHCVFYKHGDGHCTVSNKANPSWFRTREESEDGES